MRYTFSLWGKRHEERVTKGLPWVPPAAFAPLAWRLSIPIKLPQAIAKQGSTLLTRNSLAWNVV